MPSKTWHHGQQDVDSTITPLPDIQIFKHATVKNITDTVVRVHGPSSNNYLELAYHEQVQIEVTNTNLVRLSSQDDGARVCWFAL